MAGRRWLIRAFLIFLIFLLGWIGAAWLIHFASAESLPFSLNLRSRLGADYGPGKMTGSIALIRLSIVDDALRDAGLSDEVVEEQSQAYKQALKSPVPSATERNFKGEAPYSPTPTTTRTPTNTHTPTTTLTKTPLPTRTSTTTKLPRPSKTSGPPKTSTPTNTLAPTNTPTPTKTPTLVPPLSGYAESVTESVGVNNAGDSLGAPDGDYASVGTTTGSVLILDLGGWAQVSGGTQLAVYEHYINFSGCPGGIYQDQQVVSVGSGDPGAIQWTVVFVFGNDPGEDANTCILSENLYDTSAYLVNLGCRGIDTFRWVRFQNYPVGDPRTTGEQVQVDAIKVLN